VLISNTTRNAFNFVWRGRSVEKEREREQRYFFDVKFKEKKSPFFPLFEEKKESREREKRCLSLA